MKLPKIENIGFIAAAAAAMLLFFYFILGLSEMLSILGIILLFIAPAYFILDNFNLSQDEKIVFAFFIGVGVFPILAYWLGFLISFRIAIGISFVVLVALAFAIRKYKNKKHH